jgi:hypothetical protein
MTVVNSTDFLFSRLGRIQNSYAGQIFIPVPEWDAFEGGSCLHFHSYEGSFKSEGA